MLWFCWGRKLSSYLLKKCEWFHPLLKSPLISSTILYILYAFKHPFYLLEISPSGIHVDISKAEPAAPCVVTTGPSAELKMVYHKMHIGLYNLKYLMVHDLSWMICELTSHCKIRCKHILIWTSIWLYRLHASLRICIEAWGSKVETIAL